MQLSTLYQSNSRDVTEQQLLQLVKLKMFVMLMQQGGHGLSDKCEPLLLLLLFLNYILKLC